MKKILSLFLAISMIIAAVGCSAPKQTAYADQEKLENVADAVYLGNIVTRDDNGTKAEAVAVKNGKIMFVGNSEDVKKYVGTTTLVHDYGDNFIYPGFIDGHNHMGLLATMLVDGAILSSTDTLRQNAATIVAGDIVYENK